MKTSKIALVAALALLLGACSTPYQPMGLLGGYQNTRIDENTVRVTFVGNDETDKDTVENDLLYRCAEVTAHSGFDYFVLVSKETIPNTSVHTTPDDYYETTHTKYRHGHKEEYTSGTSFGGDTYTTTAYTTRAVIKMFHGQKPSGADAYNAKELLRTLGPQIDRG